MPNLDLDMWLTPQDVEKSNIGKFIDEGENSEIPQQPPLPPKPSFEIGIELADGNRRVWTMNKTNQRTISRAYGTDTRKWVGKPFELFISVQNINGTMKKVIYVKPPAV